MNLHEASWSFMDPYPIRFMKLTHDPLWCSMRLHEFTVISLIKLHDASQSLMQLHEPSWISMKFMEFMVRAQFWHVTPLVWWTFVHSQSPCMYLSHVRPQPHTLREYWMEGLDFSDHTWCISKEDNGRGRRSQVRSYYNNNTGYASLRKITDSTWLPTKPRTRAFHHMRG